MAQAIQTADQIRAMIQPGHVVRWISGSNGRGKTVVSIQTAVDFESLNGVGFYPIRHRNLAWFHNPQSAAVWMTKMQGEIAS